MNERKEDGAETSLLSFLPRPTRRSGACPRRVATLAFLVGATGCGGGLPLLHPARALAPGKLRASVGLSGNVALGPLADAARRAMELAATDPAAIPGPTGAPGDPSHRAAATSYAEGALVAASVAPGLAPLVSVRLGLAGKPGDGGYEGGLAYTGRVARADLRRAFDLSAHWTLSVGAGGSAVLYGRQEGSDLPGVDLGRLHGWGVDVPVLTGYESDGGLYLLWLGARAGGEHVDLAATEAGRSAAGIGGASTSLSATRFWGGALLGLAVGFRHLHVAMELDISYATITGDYNTVHGQLHGFTVAPASAIWWRF